jgi:hypothetical protein
LPFTKGRTKTGGRQKGVANKRTQQFQAAVADSGLTPLQYMLAVLRDETADPERRDEMAKAAAPYIHPRLASIEASHRGDKQNPLELRVTSAETRRAGAPTD